jgi:excisionase family DNA binding protein
MPLIGPSHSGMPALLRPANLVASCNARIFSTPQFSTFRANHVSSLRRQWNIPRFKPPPTIPEGELLTVRQAAAVLGTATSTVHRWLNDGFIGGEQLTPGAPWRIRLTEDLRARFVNEAPQGYLTMYQAMRLLGVSRQTVVQRVKRGELDAIHVMRGKKKGLRIKAIPAHPTLFDVTP